MTPFRALTAACAATTLAGCALENDSTTLMDHARVAYTYGTNAVSPPKPTGGRMDYLAGRAAPAADANGLVKIAPGHRVRQDVIDKEGVNLAAIRDACTKARYFDLADGQLYAVLMDTRRPRHAPLETLCDLHSATHVTPPDTDELTRN